MVTARCKKESIKLMIYNRTYNRITDEPGRDMNTMIFLLVQSLYILGKLYAVPTFDNGGNGAERPREA